jgi:hypothetical protein
MVPPMQRAPFSHPASSPRCGVALPLLVGFAVSLTGARPAHATRWVSAYDPNLQVKPPTMRAVDGTSRALVIDGDFAAAAAAYRKAHPGVIRAAGDITLNGEVVVIEGSDETLDSTAQGSAVKLGAIAQKVIAKFGDKFQAMTLWLTFDDAASAQAAAYEFTVKADVRGLGMEPRDMSPTMGSNGVLRSILNMKKIWAEVNSDDDYEKWRQNLEVWGQESGHRWMVFMKFIDRRTGVVSDALLGRDCSHYHRLVDTQSSVHDGLSWTDNGDGSFTANRAAKGRYGDLDLYGMGLLPPDEVPPFFFIDGVPGYKRPDCTAYNRMPPPGRQTVMGTRADVSVDDVIAFEGPRVPSADQTMNGERQDYFREVEVIVTRPGETADNDLVLKLAARINKARLLWERWMGEATGQRMVVCTKVSADCGDARSDLVKVTVNPERRAPTAGPTTIEAVITNGGTLPASGVQAQLTATVSGADVISAVPVGALAPGENRTIPFAIDLRAQPCGAAIAFKVATQSDQHRNRLRRTLLVGTESMVDEGFESDSGWVVNPDQTDTAQGAAWERGKPEWTEIVVGKGVQPEGAHEGTGAFVTGAAAASAGRQTFLHDGRSTLESPAFDATAWKDPQLHYWVSFTGMEAAGVGTIVPSPRARLVVLGRLVRQGGADAGADPTSDAGVSGGWIEIERFENQIQAAWSERIIALPAALIGGPMKLRFVAEDTNPRAGGVEAAIDDVQIVSNLPACYEAPKAPDGGTAGASAGGPADRPAAGCSFDGGAGRSGGLAGGLALAGLLLGRRSVGRRRRRRG